MGNYFEMLGKMEDGDVITSEYATDIMHKNGTFYHSSGTEILRGWGNNGVVINHSLQKDYAWELKEEYIEIGLTEVAERLRCDLPVYVDTSKTLIDKHRYIDKDSNHDYEDVFLLTRYFKKNI